MCISFLFVQDFVHHQCQAILWIPNLLHKLHHIFDIHVNRFERQVHEFCDHFFNTWTTWTSTGNVWIQISTTTHLSWYIGTHSNSPTWIQLWQIFQIFPLTNQPKFVGSLQGPAEIPYPASKPLELSACRASRNSHRPKSWRPVKETIERRKIHSPHHVRHEWKSWPSGLCGTVIFSSLDSPGRTPLKLPLMLQSCEAPLASLTNLNKRWGHPSGWLHSETQGLCVWPESSLHDIAFQCYITVYVWPCLNTATVCSEGW